MIEFVNVTKSFENFLVLDNISCKLTEKKTTVIIGPSGVGKSVFIKLLIGLLKPDSGKIIVDGIDISSLDEGGLCFIRKRFGMLFQDGALFDSMSVYENVAFPLRRLTDYNEDKIRRIVTEKLNLVGLSGVFTKMPSELSGGMRKRVGLARAIVLEPEILLFDEPNSGLDPFMSNAIDQLIMDMKEKLSITFVVISHDIVGTFAIADYVGMLYEGKLIEFAARNDFLKSKNPIIRDFLRRFERSI